MNTRNTIILWYLSTAISQQEYKRDILRFYQKKFTWQKMLKTFTSKRPFDIGRFDLNKRPFYKRHMSFTINNLRPTCQGYERSLKGWVGLSSHDALKDQIKLSPHRSFHLVITDPWSEGATKEGENMRWRIYLDGSNGANKSCQIWTDHVWTNIRWTDSSRRMDCLNEPIVDGFI